jgi:hypothetical protein
MRQRLSIHSRPGNMALGVVGLLYFLGAGATLLILVTTSWDGASLVDRVLQVALAGSVFAGAFFLQTAVRNLGVHPRLTLRRQ